MIATKLLVLGPDGRILQVGAGVARAWAGMRIGDAVGVPAQVVDVAAELLEEALGTTSWLGRRFVETTAGTFEFVVVEAVPLRRTRTDVRELLTRTTELLLEQARAIEVSVQVSTDPDMPKDLVIDGEKIAWGIATLVGTALRHLSRRPAKTGADGVVRVQACYLRGTDEVSIIVQDNGPGIPKERLLTILEPRQHTAHTPALGLLVLHDVATAHGGRLEIDSSTDRARHGTKVTLFLPASRATPHEHRTSS
jgi:signal transduction histidine kinase